MSVSLQVTRLHITRLACLYGTCADNLTVTLNMFFVTAAAITVAIS